MATSNRQYSGLDYFTKKPLSASDLWLYGDSRSHWLEGFLLLGVIAYAAGTVFCKVVPAELRRSYKETRQNLDRDALAPVWDALLNAVGSSAGSNARKRRAELLERIRREDGKPLQMPEGWPEDGKTECF